MPYTIHPSHSVFAIWRWSYKAWLIISPLLLIAYFLSEPVVMYLLHRLGVIELSVENYDPLMIFYYPIRCCTIGCKPLEAIWTWEWKVLSSIFGD
jgi:hypothetical protein